MRPSEDDLTKFADALASMDKMSQKAVVTRLAGIVWGARYVVTTFHHGSFEEFDQAIRILSRDLQEWDDGA